MEREHLWGRLLTIQQLPEDLLDEAIVLPTHIRTGGQLVCFRCASQIDNNWQLPTGETYCRSCLIFGRLTSQDNLYTIPPRPFPPCNALRWKGTLTPYQESVSRALCHALDNGENSLVHAVTGAGKTEMIYQVISRVIEKGGQVALVSPRIDVCMELYKRLKQDFTCPISLLHGTSDPYHRSPLVIATVHQLFKFYKAFDLILIDEVDAFPYVDNAQLYHAVSNSLKAEGLTIYLTATSTDQLDKAVQKGYLKKVVLARRFHANPLVIPSFIWLSGMDRAMSARRLPRKFHNYLKRQRQSGYPLLIFVPRIDDGERLASIIQSYFPEESVGFVASTTANRLEQVEEFRSGKLNILITTTILERGVTFPCVDVFVMWSNHRLFTKSSLIQIAGRAGRSPQRTTGDVFFFHEGKTRDMVRARREIIEMNQKGGLG